MIARGTSSRRSGQSDLDDLDARIADTDQVEVDEERTTCARNTRGGRPVSSNPRKLISIRIPVDVIERWRATGPGWQTRMVERLSKVRF